MTALLAIAAWRRRRLPRTTCRPTGILQPASGAAGEPEHRRRAPQVRATSATPRSSPSTGWSAATATASMRRSIPATRRWRPPRRARRSIPAAPPATTATGRATRASPRRPRRARPATRTWRRCCPTIIRSPGCACTAPIASADPVACQNCHRDAFCINCHQNRDSILTFVHDRNYLSFHSVDARANPIQCGNCHREDFCINCHAKAVQ